MWFGILLFVAYVQPDMNREAYPRAPPRRADFGKAGLNQLRGVQPYSLKDAAKHPQIISDITRKSFEHHPRITPKSSRNHPETSPKHPRNIWDVSGMFRGRFGDVSEVFRDDFGVISG